LPGGKLGRNAAQQSVHRTAGTQRVFWGYSELWQVSVSEPVSPQPPVTPTVGWRITTSLLGFASHSNTDIGKDEYNE